MFVDLYAVVRSAVRIGSESYSLKQVEKLYMDRPAGEVMDGGGSIVAYEEYLEHGEQATLDEIEAYNADVRVLPYMQHSLWFMPKVAACHAMANLLAEKHNKFWRDYTVLVVAGASAGIGLDALPPVRSAIGSGFETKTITLSAASSPRALPCRSGLRS